MALSTTGPRSTTTSLFSNETVPPPFPVSALFSVLCAARLPSIHRVWNAGPETIRRTVLLISSFSPFSIGPLRPPISSAAAGGTPSCFAVAERSATRAFTSIRSRISVVARLVTAVCTAGSLASGATVST
ncbi:hypothetical protein ACIQ7Q_01115 [Streptomyces sp. NPDC096176]|uniref:hypothetical protein n=1 Tax=Streptomyces sp. NPDC096176 TaxID=3366079 RepID=UPI00380034BE